MKSDVKANVLIADDSPSIRKVSRNFLEKAFPNLVFFEAGDGVDAETLFQEQHLLGDDIDLIVLDWMMPFMTGKGLLENIRSIPEFKELPKIIMLTAETYPEQVESVIKHNVSAYVLKPFTYDDLTDAVLKALTTNQGLKNVV